jgi:hypothetical protein
MKIKTNVRAGLARREVGDDPPPPVSRCRGI